MTQISRPQSDRRDTYPDSGPYTAPEWAALLAAMMSGDVDNAGVRTDYLNWLAVTTAAGDILIDTGACFVDGHLLLNDASVTITPTAPGAPATYTVVAVQNNTNAVYATDLDTPAPYAAGIPEYSARLAVLRDTVLVQTASQWMIPLATFTIAVDGTVGALTDARLFVPQVYTENIQDDAVTEAKHDASDVEYGDYHPLLRKANGAIQADSGGNARGANAIDLQQSRTLATQVASGANSFVTGEDCTASGTASKATGNGCVASGTNAHAEGLNTTASGSHSHAEGQGTTASQSEAHAEGLNTTASGVRSHAEGWSTTASGAYSHAEGYLTEASEQTAHAGGEDAVASKHAQFARSGGAFAMAGDAQYNDYHMRRSVTHGDAAWYTLYLDGAADLITMGISDQALTFDVLIVGTTQGSTKTFAFRIEGCIENDGGTTSLLASTTTTIYDADDVSFDAQAAADDPNNALLIQVQDTDSGGDTVRWSAVARTAQVRFPA